MVYTRRKTKFNSTVQADVVPEEAIHAVSNTFEHTAQIRLGHFYIPQGHTSMARFNGAPLTILKTAIAFTSKTMRSKLLTDLQSGPSWEHHHFADEALKEAILLASANDTGCTADFRRRRGL